MSDEKILDETKGRSLSDEDVAELVAASSLAATIPIVALVRFLEQEKSIKVGSFKNFLEPALDVSKYPAQTRAMLTPIWSSLLLQIDGNHKK